MSTIEKIYPLTEIQKGILFETIKSDCTNPIYIAQTTFSINSKFEIDIFLKAFSTIVDRHEVLRSAVNLNPQTEFFAQNIYKNIKIPHAVYNYTNLQKENKLKRFKVFLNTDQKKSFDLSTPPLMRLAFFKFDHKSYRIVWTRHHILLDGMSVELLTKELFVIYTALLKKQTYRLPEANSISNAFKNQLNISDAQPFWQKRLQKIEECGSLPAYHNKKSGTIESQHASIAGKEYLKLLLFVKKNKLTINTLLEGAWGIVLSHYAGKENVVFGSVRAYPREKRENCAGLFINTLPICLKISPSKIVESYLNDIYKKNKSLKKYISTPLSKIKKWCNLSIEDELFQSVVDYKPYSLNILMNDYFKELHCTTDLDLKIPSALVLEVVKEKKNLKIKLHYDTGMFEKCYARSILIYFVQILKSFFYQITAPLADLPPITEQDFKFINNWNSGYSNQTNFQTIHSLFEKQAEKNPFAIAAVYKKETITYKELNERANQLAHHLIQIGVKTEEVVPIFLKPSMNMLIAILAVLKAGGAYTPIDHSYPPERVERLLKGTNSKKIIGESWQFELFNKLSLKALIINIDQFEFSSFSRENLKLVTKPTQLMYVIYTSGSTGTPKGVMVEHQSVTSMALSCISKFKINNKSRMLQISSFSFDVCVAEWCTTLLSGATLYLIERDIFSPTAIVTALKNYKISHIILASSILTNLPQQKLPNLKVIATGGEPCAISVINFWAKNRLFFNVYGITETTVCSTVAVYKPNQNNTSIIGKPLSNTKVYILGQNLSLLPVGTPGEICIRGIGVARGYINNQAMTAEKFINKFPKMLTINEAGPLYKTGDLGRWLPSGELEFLGRLDEQVKIRGFRVEPAEIERALEKNPLINKAVVINDGKLRAYILSNNKHLNLLTIKKFIGSKLPSYMIPSTFHQIEQLPLTPNGKVDKAKLLTPKNNNQPVKNLKFSSQMPSMQKNISEIIKTILNINNIPENRNFFDIGFDSISLAHFSIQLNKKLNVKIDILDLFSYPTVDDLSMYIEGMKDKILI